MANKSIQMSRVRQILKLHHQHMGKKRIAERLGMSKNTVKHYVELYLKLKIPLDELLRHTDQALYALFHPPQGTIVSNRLEELYSFFPQVEKAMRKRGMTLYRQYDEYCKKYENPFRETAFYGYYRKWKKRVNPSMHIEHKSGDKLYVDFAGDTLPYVDRHTGEILRAEIFVAILGWSQYVYATAVAGQGANDFITCCEQTLRCIGGVPLAIVPDNLKSAVIKASKYEPQLNENLNAFAQHYGCSILPARVRKPKDKAHVENMVKIIYSHVHAAMPEDKVFTLDELNVFIADKIQLLNEGPLTGKNYSRADQLIMEAECLQPLRDEPFELRKIKLATVQKNYHVELKEDKHYYSVPYQLIGKKLRLSYTATEVHIYQNYELVVEYQRDRMHNRYTTQKEHMPPAHAIVAGWNPNYFLERGRAIDPVVEAYIGKVLDSREHPEITYRSCNGVLSFIARVGKERLINACKVGLNMQSFGYHIIAAILKKNIDKMIPEEVDHTMPRHENIRGGDYYK